MKRNVTRLIACAACALLYLVATVPSARSYPPLLRKAKELGLPANDCAYCHATAKGGQPLGERAKWLVAEKGRRGAAAVDVAWLKEYTPQAQGPAGQATGSQPGQGQTTGDQANQGAAQPSGQSSTQQRPAGQSPAGQTAGQQAGQSATAGQQSGSAEQAIEKLHAESFQAILRADTAVLERAWADDYSLTNPGGNVMEKAGFIGALKSGGLKFETLDLSDTKVRIYGDAAVVTGRATVKAKGDSQDISEQVRYMSVYVKRQGHWRAVAMHTTRIAQQ
jgi:hypothetical protein